PNIASALSRLGCGFTQKVSSLALILPDVRQRRGMRRIHRTLETGRSVSRTRQPEERDEGLTSGGRARKSKGAARRTGSLFAAGVEHELSAPHWTSCVAIRGSPATGIPPVSSVEAFVLFSGEGDQFIEPRSRPEALEEPVVAGEVPVVDPAANLDRMLQPAQG